MTLWLGGLLCGGGLILIAFVQSLWSFYLGIGIMVGLGFSFVILVGSATISRYFKTKRPMAIAFAMTGVPLMSIMFPLFYELVYSTYGLFGSIAIIGAVQLNVCVGGTFFRPIKLESDGAQLSASIFVKLKRAFGRLIRYSSMLLLLNNASARNPDFLLYSTSIALVISGKFMVNPFLKDFAVKNVGLDKYQPAMILSICSGIGECKHTIEVALFSPLTSFRHFLAPLGWPSLFNQVHPRETWYI